MADRSRVLRPRTGRWQTGILEMQTAGPAGMISLWQESRRGIRAGLQKHFLVLRPLTRAAIGCDLLRQCQGRCAGSEPVEMARHALSKSNKNWHLAPNTKSETAWKVRGSNGLADGARGGLT